MHTGGSEGGEGGMKQYPPRQIFEKLVNKNAIKVKPKIAGPPRQFFLKPLTPPRNFGKNIPYPLPWIFNPCASMDMWFSVPKLRGVEDTGERWY
jgi:hypothetical protein